ARLPKNTAGRQPRFEANPVGKISVSCASRRTRKHFALSAMLTVSQLSKSFAGRALFDDVSLCDVRLQSRLFAPRNHGRAKCKLLGGMLMLRPDSKSPKFSCVPLSVSAFIHRAMLDRNSCNH